MSNCETNSDLKDLIKETKDMEIKGNEKETIVSFAGQLKKLDSEEDAKPIMDAIIECKRLVTLNLEGNTLGISAAKGLAKCLESKPDLKIALFNNLFTGRLKTEIPEVLTFITSGIILSNAKLHTLDLSDNAIGPVGMPSLLPFLQSPSCESLETLRLNNCGLGVGGGKILAKGLVNLKVLKTLICGRNRLEIMGSQAIGNSLAELTTLETLEMPQNGIHSKGIEAICKAIEANKSMKSINLNDNNLKTQSTSMASVLKSLKCIESINFGDCLLKSTGCLAICEALIQSNASNIKEINLSGNEIKGEEAIEALISCGQKLAKSLKSINKLKLELSNNNFGDFGVKKLVNSLGQEIDLNISDDEGSDLEEEDEEGRDDEEEEEEEDGDDNNLEEEDKEKDIKSEIINKSSEVLIEELTKKIENESSDINDLCTQFVKISVEGFDSQTSSLKEEALITSEIYLKSAIGCKQNEYLAMNTLLVKLGLLKDESGIYEKVDDLRGPLSALTHSIKHLSPQQKQVLRAFMNRPNKSVEQCGKVKHSLMKQLFI